MNYRTIIVCMSFIIACLSMFLMIGELNGFIEVYIILVTVLLTLFGFKLGKFSPSFLLVLSIFIFIWMRPFLSLFFDVTLVEAGYYPKEENLLITTGYIGFVISLIILSYTLFFNYTHRISTFYIQKYNYKFTINKSFNFLFYIAILLGFLFLFHSINKMSLLGSLSYFEITATNNFYEHLFFFFLSKQLIILYLLLESNKKKNFIFISLIIFIFSIGFMLIGLRGYTIAYMFTLLFFINLQYRINFAYLIIIGISLIYVAALVIEFRLGFKLYDSFMDIVLKTFLSQGASFEVVYGSVTYQTELKECISYLDYFNKIIPFGDCVDKVRGVNFSGGGGFASAFFAEILYFSYFGVIIFTFLIGLIVAILDRLYLIIINEKNQEKKYFIYLLFFLILPNLVYLGRSSAFDLISKFIVSSLLIFLFINLLKIFKKITKDNNDYR